MEFHRKCLTQDAAEKAIQAFVISRLDCNNSFLYGLPRCELEKLQKFRILPPGAKRDSHITQMFKHLHCFPISCRIKYKILTLTYECINNLAPVYLTEVVKLRPAGRQTRSADDDLTLETPRTKLVTAGDRTFSDSSPLLWNRLPYTLRAVDLFEIFKSRLKTHLFREFFN